MESIRYTRAHWIIKIRMSGKIHLMTNFPFELIASCCRWSVLLCERETDWVNGWTYISVSLKCYPRHASKCAYKHMMWMWQRVNMVRNATPNDNSRRKGAAATAAALVRWANFARFESDRTWDGSYSFYYERRTNLTINLCTGKPRISSVIFSLERILWWTWTFHDESNAPHTISTQ